MIYVWLANIRRMNLYNSHQSYWESIDYKYILEGKLPSSIMMVEEETPLWKN